ncbi:MAG: hypothetical protein GC146_17285 [Limimaricola sp.]|uniref:hypothetical protein n=1 Tax=Limimaricola sp. TaxID=2211665 RepID=UPI001D64E72D|nr:hypothetical protein [Limimaricola sp.]MBI1418966.1 hypothetical protein [Limimaricola sp.]
MKTAPSLPFSLSAALLSLMVAAPAGALVLPEDVAAHQQAIESDFVTGDGFETIDPQSLLSDDWYSKARFPNAPQDSVFPPDHAISSVVRAILMVEKEDKPLKSVRYRVTIRRVAASPEYPEAYTDLIEISRFNLGPVLREQTMKDYPGVPVGPESEFGIGPNVTWRFAMQPVQGTRSSIDLAARHVMSDAEAAAAQCFDTSCLALEPVSGPDGDWTPLPPVEPNEVSFKASDGINATPAKVADALMRRATPDGLRAYMADYAPVQMTIVISRNVLGQDVGIDGLLHQGHVRDDAISDVWLQRRQAGPGTIDWRRMAK